MEPSLDFNQLKGHMRAMWSAGDFGQIARYSAPEAARFVERLHLQPGMKVLDVACGTGNLAIPAARQGALVTGLDLAANLLEQARARAAAEGLPATFDLGDAEDLPYPDDSFDVVMSMYGAMFAPRPERVVAELCRVCRSGGTVAMANWTPGGFVGESFRRAARFAPPPPGIPAPVLWGDESVVRERFDGRVSALHTQTRQITMDYPFGPGEVVGFFREYFGPTRVGFARLDPPAQAAYAADLEQHWREHNQGGEDRTVVHAEYLEVKATLF